MSTATTKPASAPVKPWHFHTHLLRLFASRPAATRPGAETWNSLDGWRGALCLWMVAFHSFFYSGNFAEDDSMHNVGLSPSLLLLNLGFLPVDGFFVLTGFLIAYPLFKEELRRIKRIQEEEGNEATTTAAAAAGKQLTPVDQSASPWTFDLSSFYYRRVTRMLPSYALAVYFHCGVLFPNLIQHSMQVVRSNSYLNFIDRVLPGLKDAPNHCTAGYLWTNFTWTNHIMPFGGCMGWTWSFALQFNFYLFFPLLWKWAHTRLARRPTSSRATPSSLIMPFLYAFLALSVLTRCLSFLQIRRFDLRHEEGVFIGFFWYSNTFTRGSAIVWGVIAAHASVHTGFIGYLRRQGSWLVSLGWALFIATVTAQMLWNRIFAEGSMLETPGWTALKLTQESGGKESLNYTTPNLLAYAHHAFFHVFVLVGSPASNLIFVFLLLVVVNGLGSVGRAVQRFLSHPIWFPISTLSWWVYLVHPAVMTRYYVWTLENGGELDMTAGGVWRNAAVQWVLSFSIATVAFVFIEQPLELLLRQGEAAQVMAVAAAPKVAVSSSAATPAAAATATPSSPPATFFSRLRGVIFVYCVVCMIYIALHHVGILAGVAGLEPKEYIEKANALPTRTNGLRNVTATA